jgi:hypothetical protein
MAGIRIFLGEVWGFRIQALGVGVSQLGDDRYRLSIDANSRRAMRPTRRALFLSPASSPGRHREALRTRKFAVGIIRSFANC